MAEQSRETVVSGRASDNNFYNENCKGTVTDPKVKAACDRALAQVGTSDKGSITGCGEAEEELNRAKGDFTTQCSAMGLQRGVKECAQEVAKCRGQKKTEKKNYCPGTPDSDRQEKQLEKAEERLDKLKEKVPELQEKVTEGTSDANNKIAELRQKGRDAMTETTKAIKQAGRDKEEKQSKIVEQLSQLSSQLLQMDEQTGSLELSKTDAAMKRDEAKTAIDNNCHQTASATVAKLQSDALGRMQAGTYSRGNQNALLKNVGMSDRESWQKVAEKYYGWCLRSKPTTDSKDSANRMYTQAIAQADKAIENIKKRKALLQAQINKMKDPNGACGSAAPAADGSTGETDTCRANRQAAEDMQELRNEYGEKMKGINEDIQRTQTDGMRKVMSQQQALANAQRNLNDETTRVNNLRNALDGDSLSKEDTGDFKKAHSKWASAALNADACCAKGSSFSQDFCTRNAADLVAAGYEAAPPYKAPSAGPAVSSSDTIQAGVAPNTTGGGGETSTPRQPSSQTTTPRQNHTNEGSSSR